MNPLPLHAVATFPALVDLLALLSMLSVMVIFSLLLWATWRQARERTRLRCPVRLRSARVLFRTAADGKRLDVLRCSVFRNRPVTCGKPCLHAARA